MKQKDSRERRTITVAITLAETDLDTLRDGDWLNWRADLAEILCVSSGQEGPSEAEIYALQPVVKKVLSSIVDYYAALHGPDKAESYPTHAHKTARFTANNIQTLQFVMSADGFSDARVTADLQDAFLLALGFAFRKVSATLIRKCIGCEKLFLAEHGLQEYHDHKCSQREATRRYREGLKQQAEESSPPHPLSQERKQEKAKESEEQEPTADTKKQRKRA